MGKIVATHGVKGRVKIKTFTTKPEDLVSYGDLQDQEGKIYQIKITGQQPDNLLCEIEGIKSMEAAEELKGMELFALRKNMPEPESGSYYFSDLKGLSVKLNNSEEYGSVYAVNDYGAGVILEIRQISGIEESYTLNEETFPEVNIEEGYIIFNPPEFVEVK